MDSLGDGFRWQFTYSVVQQLIQYMRQSTVALRRMSHIFPTCPPPPRLPHPLSLLSDSPPHTHHHHLIFHLFRIQSTPACARVSRAARAVASARVCLGSSSSTESAAVVHAHATTLHDAHNSGRASGLLPVQWSTCCSLGVGSHGPTRRKGTKGGVSGLAEDLGPVSEVQAG